VTSFRTPEPFTEPDSDGIFRSAGDRVLFLAQEREKGQELWASDGSAEGTRALTDFAFGQPFGFGPLSGAVRLGNHVLMAASDVAGSTHLWTVPIGGGPTSRLEDCRGGCPEEPEALWQVGPSRAVFFARGAGALAKTLFVSNGTAEGTRAAAPCAGCQWPGYGAVVADDRIFFVGSSEVWQTDGTKTRTRQLFSKPEAAEVKIQVLGSRSWFGIGGTADAPARLLAMEATAPRPRMVGRLERLRSSSYPFGFHRSGSGALFCARSPNPSSLWFSDGLGARPLTTPGVLTCPEGLKTVADGRALYPTSDGLVVIDPASGEPRIAASSGWIDWIVPLGHRAAIVRDLRSPRASLDAWDGGASIHQIRPLSDGLEYSDSFYPLDDTRLAFIGSGGVWVSDLTVAGTHLVPGSPVDPQWHGERQDGKAIVLGDGALWQIDGTNSSVKRLGSVPAELQSPRWFPWGEAVLVVGTKSVGPLAEELWIVRRGQPTSRLAAFESVWELRDLAERGRRFAVGLAGVFFVARRPESGEELWVTDGTVAGTRLVADLLPGPQGSAAGEVETASDGRVVFAAADLLYGFEPRTTDGFDVQLLRDVWPGVGSSLPAEFFTVGSRTFFRADDGEVGQELWMYEP
jgi:ELWxxDGT repeat protein